jgi:ppGpp synthetase/RelA/SpoT-type nucleotidyltranferase
VTRQISDEEVLTRRKEAEDWHHKHAATYGDLAERLHDLLKRELKHHGVVAQAVTYRVKSLRSLQDKWVRPADDDPSVFKYDDPARQITDIAGVRVVTYLQHLVPKVQELIASALETTGPENRAGLDDPSIPGYRGVHYLVELPAARLALREYQHLVGCRAKCRCRPSSSTPGPRSSTTPCTRAGRKCRRTSVGVWWRWPACWSSPTLSSGTWRSSSP